MAYKFKLKDNDNLNERNFFGRNFTKNKWNYFDKKPKSLIPYMHLLIIEKVDNIEEIKNIEIVEEKIEEPKINIDNSITSKRRGRSKKIKVEEERIDIKEKDNAI